MTLWTLLALPMALGLLWPPDGAQAQPRARTPAVATSQPRARPRPRVENVVFIAPRDHAVQAQAVAKVIGAQLRDMRVVFQLRWVPRLAVDAAGQLAVAKRVAKARRALVVVWCDFTNGVKLQMYYALPGQNRVLVRTVDQAATAQGRAESMGLIVRGGVEVLLSLRRTARPRPRPRPPVVRPVPTPTTPPPPPAPAIKLVSAGLALGYGLGGYATQGPTVTHMGQLSFRLLFRRRWSAFLSYGATPDIRAQTEAGEATVILHRHGLRLGGGHRWVWGRVYLGLEGAFLLDLLDRRHRATGMQVEPSVLDVNLGLEAVIRVGYRVTPWLAVYTGAAATVMLRNRDYRVDWEGEPVLRPWAVQPRWVVGLELKVF